MRTSKTAIVGVAIAIVVGQAMVALAVDEIVVDSDGDSVYTNQGVTFGQVCPDHTYADDVALVIQRNNATSFTSFQAVAGSANEVTWGFDSLADADGAQEFATGFGTLSASFVGSPVVDLPTGWQTKPQNDPTTGLRNVAPVVVGRVTLTVPANATLGQANPSGSDGTVRWRANGVRTASAQGNYVTTPLGQATDANGANRFSTNEWTVMDPSLVACNRAPSVAASFEDAHVACGDTALTVSVGDADLGVPGSGESLTVGVDWDGDDVIDASQGGITQAGDVTLSAPYGAGMHTASVVVTDQHDVTAEAEAEVAVDLGSSGILQPVNANGSSIFKAGSTVPVKVRFTACDGSVPDDLAPSIEVFRTGGSSPVTGVVEAALSTSAHDDGVMRFSDGQWIYNLSTKSLSDPTATYTLVITVALTGQTIEVGFGLR